MLKSLSILLKLNSMILLKMKTYIDRITVNPEIMLGKPVIKGTRITVELILRKLSEGTTIEELLEAYPHLTKEDILAVLEYAADVISTEKLIVPEDYHG